MTDRYCFEAVDRLFRDVMKSINPLLASIPFGGKKILFGGDFRQYLPVILRGSRAEIINSTLKSSYLWTDMTKLELTTNMRMNNANDNEYRQFLINLDNGHLPTPPSQELPMPILYL